MVAKFQNKRSGEIVKVDAVKKVDKHISNIEGTKKEYWRAFQNNGNERMFSTKYWECLNENR